MQRNWLGMEAFCRSNVNSFKKQFVHFVSTSSGGSGCRGVCALCTSMAIIAVNKKREKNENCCETSETHDDTRSKAFGARQ